MEILIVIGLWAVGFAVLALVIRYAIDSSKASSKIDLLTDEIRMLRRDLRRMNEQTASSVSEGRSIEIKHIIDHKI